MDVTAKIGGLMRRLFVAFLLLLAGLLPMSLASSAPAGAIPSGGLCAGTPPEPSQFDGVLYSLLYETIGTAADITDRFAQVCNNSHAASSVWSMVAGNGDDYHYVQSGYAVQGTSGSGAVLHFFSQMNDGSSGGTCTGTCAEYDGVSLGSYGENHLFWQYYEAPGASCPVGCVTSWVDTSLFLVTPYNPYATGQWQEPINNFYSGEIDDPNIDIAGNNTEGWTTFTQMRWQNTLSGAWSAITQPFYTSPYYPSPPARASHDLVAQGGATRGNAMDIYCTSQCTS